MIKQCYDIVYKFDYFTVKPLLINEKKQLADKLSDNFNKYKDEYPYCFNDSITENIDNFINNNINVVTLLKIRAGVDNVFDTSFTMQPEKQLLAKFGITDEMHYLTFQCGVGGKGILNDMRCWSVENWKKLLAILKTRLSSNIKFVHVGVSGYCFDEADINLSGKTSLDELFCILTKSLFHIDIDGACSHFAKAVGTKSLVMFGPTNGELIGYNENINIISSLCGSCWLNIPKIMCSKCPIGYDKPLCMESITPEFVAEKIIGYLKDHEKN